MFTIISEVKNNSSLARLASVFINIHLSTINRWLSISFTENINTNILYCIYTGIRHSNHLACFFPSNSYRGKSKELLEKVSRKKSTYFQWSWAIYLISFLFLLLTLFIINNNIAVNKKLYETDG